ncbi:MAG TPA: zinc ribbon domain-containing protein [Acidobacteriota bacterium]|nr:zinc ribbon domain-containing protein [Acidobacteriota bacterium]
MHSDNRKGEKFLCRHCGHTADADTVGAQNILARTLATFGSVESPELQREVSQSV